MRIAILAPITAALLVGFGASLGVGCTAAIGVNIDGGPDTSVPDSSPPPGDAGVDVSSDVAMPEGGPWVIAPHSALPQVQNNGGPVVSAPVITSVSFPGYDQVTTADSVASTLGTSGAAYWSTLVEYGVNAATAGTPVHLTEAAPTTIDDTAVQTWLAGKLDGTHPEFGTPSSSSVYVIFYPSTTTVTLMGMTSCTDMGGYHNSILLSAGSFGGQNVSYAVIPECNLNPMDPNGLKDSLTESVSHEVTEAVTDPYPLTMMPGAGWSGADSDHSVWEIILAGGEVADLCAQFADSFFTPPGYPFMVQRVWSNMSAQSGHDPCQPALPNEVYFNAAPVLADSVTIMDMAQSFMTKGALIPLAGNKTVEVDLYSDGPMGAWTLSADDFSPNGGQFLTFKWDSTTGQNGDKRQLTITAVASNPMFGGEPFEIVSTSGGAQHVWLGYVAQN